ncbi:MAG: glycosyltransferase family 4 protein [Syntrophaceae bacterium]
MRIVHINLERGWRGGERQTLFLMQGLRSLGHDSTLLARHNDGFVDRVREEGFPVIVMSKPFFFHGGSLFGFDIVHAHETRGLQLAALWKPFHQSPLVYTRRVDTPPGRHAIDRLKYTAVDRLVAISGKVAEVMTGWGFDPPRMKVIHSAVPLRQDLGMDSVEKLRQRFPDRTIVGCVASLEKRKDHGTLLDTAAIVQQERGDVLFVLVGDGDLRGELEKKALKLGLHNVVFEGYQDDPYPYYGVFDVFVMTSRVEGLGSSILDAFRYRVPVVATSAGGIPEIVKDGRTGLLARVGDPCAVAGCILRMLDDQGLHKSCTENAYALLEKEFTIETMARSYEALYREVAGSGASRVR